MKVWKVIGVVGCVFFSSGVFADLSNDKAFNKKFVDNQKAMEFYAVSKGKAVPVVRHYKYGMDVDAVRVVSVVKASRVCGPAPTAMTYEDSKGQLNTLKYTVYGECKAHGG
ncbi:DUF2790 domain-containing protein [Pseudomonas fluorescens]|uniref:DUF2790 domain-containing protein n=1 Tax=Pseudomonas fluorescens TaxID=294 RepID=UPI00209AE69A|nr:DUF2790 domain-containing protein [Pseudomonas fluorescens]MCO7624896.1 DUF2790 domain-containing protein [Pseudomonas fluorescens]